MDRTSCLAALVGLVCFAAGPVAAACSSGPDYCTDDPRIPAALKAKKERLLKDYPERLVSLLDRGVQCVARIRTSPDGFFIIDVEPGKAVLGLPWSQDVEKVSRKRLQKGEITHYWLVNARTAFQCDGEPEYESRPDHIAAEDVTADLAIRCDGLGC